MLLHLLRVAAAFTSRYRRIQYFTPEIPRCRIYFTLPASLLSFFISLFL